MNLTLWNKQESFETIWYVVTQRTTEFGNEVAGVTIMPWDQFALVSHGPDCKGHSRGEVTWQSETEHRTGSQEVCLQSDQRLRLHLSDSGQPNWQGRPGPVCFRPIWKSKLGISKVPRKGTSASPSSLPIYRWQLIPWIQTEWYLWACVWACMCVCMYVVGGIEKIRFNTGSFLQNSLFSKSCLRLDSSI